MHFEWGLNQAASRGPLSSNNGETQRSSLTESIDRTKLIAHLSTTNSNLNANWFDTLSTIERYAFTCTRHPFGKALSENYSHCKTIYEIISPREFAHGRKTSNSRWIGNSFMCIEKCENDAALDSSTERFSLTFSVSRRLSLFQQDSMEFFEWGQP